MGQNRTECKTIPELLRSGGSDHPDHREEDDNGIQEYNPNDQKEDETDL